jgi:hypothetical protein
MLYIQVPRVPPWESRELLPRNQPFRSYGTIGGQKYEIASGIAEHVKTGRENLEEKGDRVEYRPEKYKGAKR